MEIKIEGPIGESSSLFTKDFKDVSKVTLNLEKVTYINSIGVKNWILWIARLPASTQLVLKDIPIVMVNQANTVRGFLPAQSEIASFQAPYLCPECGTEKTILLRVNEHYRYASGSHPGQIKLPQVVCPKCGKYMDPDFIEQKTFAFINRQ